MLDDIDFFHMFSADERRRLEIFCQLRTLSGGESLFFEGEEASAFYIVKSGKLEVYRVRDGVETRVGYIGPSDIVGEMALFDRKNSAWRRNASIRALEPTELVVMIEESIHLLGDKEPRLREMIAELIRARKEV